MRTTRIPNPLPSGKGFSVGRIVAALAASVALAAAPARADTVRVTLVVSFAEPASTVVWDTCPVDVAEGADGVEVLDAADQSGCIDSYEAREFPGLGRYIACINGVCDTPATYWRMTENGKMTDYGVDAFEANAGDQLGFSYTTWLSCLTPLGC